jgi:flagellar protein FliL
MATKTAPLKSAEKDDAPAPQKSKKKLLVIAVLALLLGGGGAGGYFFFLAGDSEPPPPEPGVVAPLEAITVNLAGGHFLKVRIALQATAEAAEAPDGSKALDLTINEFSNRSVAELSSNKARGKAKEELKQKVVEAYEGEVMDLYFTEFVMQ